MTLSFPASGLQVQSLIKRSGKLELSLASVDVSPPGPDEVIIRIEASPLSHSDLGLLFGAADMSTARQIGTAAHPIVTADVPPTALAGMAGRLDQPLPVGNEGAGIVVAAGSSSAALALLGKAVAVVGGAMFAQCRAINAADCLMLPEEAAPDDGASSFINPLTVLGMVETMRREDHKALVRSRNMPGLREQ